MSNGYEVPDLAIAIVGMAGTFPGAADVEALWSNLTAGVESVQSFTPDELVAMGAELELVTAPSYVRAAGVISHVREFDAAFFGYSPREAELMDPQHRVFLEQSWAALENAGIVSDGNAKPIGVYAGCGPSSYLIFNLVPHAALMAPENLMALMNGNDKDSLATRVAYKLNLKGPALTVQTACSTSLVAVHLAAQSLLSGACDVAMAGGVTMLSPERTGYLFQKGEITSPDGHCRAFDEKAGGTVFSSGAGVVVMKRLEDALADGSHIHAVLRGTAINNDGAQKIGFTAPSIEGQAEVIAQALGMAGLEPGDIGYVETHGTGTAVGDPAEIAGLRRAYGGGEDGGQPPPRRIPIGALKTNLGHLDTAAGVAGLIKTAMVVNRGQIPATLHFEKANPQIAFERTPFFVNAALREWSDEAAPRRAGVSSFGIGGTNAHAIVEQPPPRAASAERALELLPLAARTPEALAAMAQRLAAHLEAHPEHALVDVAHTLQVGRRPFACRTAVVAADRAQAIASLRRAAALPQVETANGAVMMFPGQGSQFVGMGRELYRQLPVFRAAIDECAALLRPHLEVDLLDVILNERTERATIDRTDVTQPLLFTVQYALAQVWKSYGVTPAALIGHSVGEYVAACLAGVFSLADGLRLIAARGRLMQSTARGAMLVVPLAAAEVELMLVEGVEIAAINSDRQCVVAGSMAAITAMQRVLEAEDLSTRLLPAERAFHSRLMEPILDEYEREVARARLSPPKLAVASNLTGQWLTPEEATSPKYWVAQLRGAVRFGEGSRLLLEAGYRVFLEVGPGRGLCNFVRAAAAAAAAASPATGRRAGIGEPALVTCLPVQQNGRGELGELLFGLGNAWAAGLELSFRGAAYPAGGQLVPLPSYPFERRTYWIHPPQRQAAGSSLALTAAAAAAAPAAVAHDGFESEHGNDFADRRLANGSSISAIPSEMGASILAAVNAANAAAASPVSKRHQRPALAVAYLAPADELERGLTEIWEELLGVAGIGIHDNFFDLGGDSLIAVRLIARVRERFAVDLDGPVLFDCATVSRLAEKVGERLAASQSAEPAAWSSEMHSLIDGMTEEQAEAMLAEMLAAEERQASGGE